MSVRTLQAHPGGNALPFKFRELLTMAQVAVYLQKSSEAARIWCRRKKLPMSKVGREWRVDQRDLDAAIAKDTRVALQKAVAR